MEEEMIRLQYVMPVELAIKREIEYRTKMEVLKNLRQNSLTPLLPLLVPPPGQVGLKRKEPSKNLQAVPPKQPSSNRQALQKRSIGLVCKACEMDFSTVIHLKQHMDTRKHRGNIFQMKVMRQNVSTPFLCKLCDSSCSTAMVMEHHLNGTKHAESLEKFEDAKRSRAHKALAANR